MLQCTALGADKGFARFANKAYGNPSLEICAFTVRTMGLRNASDELIRIMGETQTHLQSQNVELIRKSF